MFLGRVVGTVWSTVKWKELGGLKLLIVKPYHLRDLARPQEVPATPDTVVCADLMDAGVGDMVIVAYGHAARVAAWEVLLERPGAACPDAPPIPIDAAIVAVVDDLRIDQGAMG